MHRIRAVCINTIRQALRLKIALVFIVLLFVLLPVMGSVMTGDGTLKGRLQSFISYSMSLVTLLLSLLTIIIAVYSVTSDIDQKQIFTVITKPIRRHELLLGKLLGILVLDLVLLAFFSSAIYAITRLIPRYYDVPPQQAAQVDNEFFTARAQLNLQRPDVSDQVQQTVERLRKNNRLPEEFDTRKDVRQEVIKDITHQKQIEARSVANGMDKIWHFYQVRPFDPDDYLFIRFKYEVSVDPPDQHIYSRWLIGDLRQIELGQRVETPIYPVERKDTIRAFHEFIIPADAVADDGYLAVGFLNLPVNNTVVIFPEDGFEVLYQAGAFGGNFLRAALMIYAKLIFLACLGIFAASYLSFPVAILFCLAVFMIGSMSTFILESFSTIGGQVEWVYFYSMRFVVELLPQFDKISVSEYLVPARFLSWSFLMKTAAVLVGIKALLLLVLSLLIFRTREIAKVVV